MPPERAAWWLRMALGDLAAARALTNIAGVAPRQAVYLAQQAAEKALKATIALEGIEPPWSHDLILLLARIPGEAGLHDLGIDIVQLSSAQTVARYPDLDDPPYALEEAERLVADAGRLVAAVLAHFERAGLAGSDVEPA